MTAKKFYWGKVTVTAVCLAGMTIFSGCDDKNDPNEDAITVINEQSLTQEVFADDISGNSLASFTTKDPWTSSISEINSSAESVQMRSSQASGLGWISIDPSSGNKAGTYDVAIILKPNATGEDRTAVVTIECNGAEIKITVTQKATKENGEPYESVPVTGVTLDRDALTLHTGDTETLTATVQPDTATNKDVTWKSNRPDIVEVDNYGNVIAIAEGSAVISVTTISGGFTDECVVTVEKRVMMPMTMTTMTGEVMFNVAGKGTVTIDWGDGSPIETYILVNDRAKSFSRSYSGIFNDNHNRR